VDEGSTAYNSQRKVAVSADGRLVAVTYVEPGVDGASVVRAKLSRDGGASWERLPAVSRAAAFRSTVALDGARRLQLSWTELAGEHRQVFHATWDGGPAWQGRRQLSDTPGYSGYPALAVDAADGLHLVWYGYDGRQYQVYYRHRPAGGEWAPAVQATRWVDDANAPALALGPDGRAHVAFYGYHEGRHETYYLAGGPAGWSSVERVSPEGEAAALPSIAVGADGVPRVAYVLGEGAATTVVHTERGADGAWTPPVPVSAPGERADDPSLALAGPGGAVWVAYDTPEGAIRLARPAADGSWEREVVTDVDADAAWPSLSWAAWPEGVESAPVFAAWTERGGGGGSYHLAVARVGEAVERVAPRWAEPGPSGRVWWLLAAVVLGGAIVAMARQRNRRRHH
jgi:hypothetical protein